MQCCILWMTTTMVVTIWRKLKSITHILVTCTPLFIDGSPTIGTQSPFYLLPNWLTFDLPFPWCQLLRYWIARSNHRHMPIIYGPTPTSSVSQAKKAAGEFVDRVQSAASGKSVDSIKQVEVTQWAEIIALANILFEEEGTDWYSLWSVLVF